jgi:hypothetical protein
MQQLNNPSIHNTLLQHILKQLHVSAVRGIYLQ